MRCRLAASTLAILSFLGCGGSGYQAQMLNPHPSDWTLHHADAYQQDRQSCVPCHGSTTVPAQSGGPSRTSCFTCHDHAPGAACGNCHWVNQSLWASPQDLHAADAATILTDAAHDTSELLTDSCLKCHASFQYPLGISHFVTPLDQVGQPAGAWTALNTGDWQATKCEVCHDPQAANPGKLAKYGAVLDGPWQAAYTNATQLPAAYQTVIDPVTGAWSTYIYPDQTTLGVQATRLCNSCHDPADQGAPPDTILGGVDYGPQGGDSRAFVTLNHQGLACIDCHPTHDFTPLDPGQSPTCTGTACHSLSRAGTLPGKVHLNHL